MRSRELTPLEDAIGHRFANRELLENALTHTSYAHEVASRNSEAEPQQIPHNEQMEFLGDAVLGLIASDELFRRFPDFEEGQLSKMRAHLVSERHLIKAANELNIGSYLKLGHGEEKTGGRAKTALLVDALEALIAAVYLDGGLPDARRYVIEKIIGPELEHPDGGTFAGLPVSDFKSALQEKVHELGRPHPDYVLIHEEGPEHQKTFTVEARIHAGVARANPEYVGRAQGPTKKRAEQEAARLALAYLEAAGDPPQQHAGEPETAGRRSNGQKRRKQSE